MVDDVSPDGELIDAIAVARRLGLDGRSQVNGYLHRYQDFPRPIHQPGRGHGRLWRQDEIDSWADAWRPVKLSQIG